MVEPSRPDKPIHETTTEARAGSGPADMRYVVIGGLALVIVLFVVIFVVLRP